MANITLTFDDAQAPRLKAAFGNPGMSNGALAAAVKSFLSQSLAAYIRQAEQNAARLSAESAVTDITVT